MTKKNAYIRIGSDKAGTVTLMRLVSNNKSQFFRHGINTPMVNCILLADHLVKENHLSRLNFFDSQKNHLLINFNEFISNKESYLDHNIFCVTEAIWGRLKNKNVMRLEKDITSLFVALKNFFPYHNVKIMLHLRRPDLYYESLLRQAIKAGECSHDTFFRKFKETNLAKNYTSLYKILVDVFGLENLIIRPFEISQFVNNDFVVDTLHFIGLDDVFHDFTIDIGNPSLNQLLCETLLITNTKYGKLLTNTDLLNLSHCMNKTLRIPKNAFLSAKEQNFLLSEFNSFYCELGDNHAQGKPFFIEPIEESKVNTFFSQEQIGLMEKAIIYIHTNGFADFVNKFPDYFSQF